MGVFGPTNEELENLRAEFERVLSQGLDNLRQNIEAKITAVEAAAAVRATDSEESAKSAAEQAARYAAVANESGENIQSTLQEIMRYKQIVLNELESLKEEITSATALSEKLQGQIDTTQNVYTEFIEQKTTLDSEIESLEEKMQGANEYLDLAEKLPEAVKEAQNSLNNSKILGESIKSTLNHAVSRKSEIDHLHKLILGEDVDDADGESQHINGIKDKLDASYKELAETSSRLEGSVKDLINNLTNKYDTLLSNRQGEYEDILKTAAARYEQINNQITGLLPGAMAEGLSAAYDKKKDSEEISLSKFERRFAFAIFSLVFVSIIPFAVDIYLLAFEGQDLVQVVKDTPSLIVSILPIYFPFLWLAYSTSKKANLSKRLIEEYTHKSVLGKTFSGLSNQIETLQNQGAVKEELRTKLLFNILQVSAENPGKLITDYNKSDHPIMDALEKSSKLSESLETLAKIPGLSAVAKRLSEKGDIELRRQGDKVDAGLKANERLEPAATQSEKG